MEKISTAGGESGWVGGVAITSGQISPTTARPRMVGAYVLTAILGAVALGLLFLAQNIHQRDGRVSPAVIVLYGIGLGVAVLTLVYQRWAKRMVHEADAEEARRAQFPDQPWKWKTQWQKPFIESQTGGGAVAFWVFAIMWNAISTPAAWIIFHDPNREKAANLIFIFPLVGLLMLWGAVYQTVRWRKFGRTRFVLSTMPGAIGGYLGGVIEVPARVTPEADAKLTLKCVRRVTTGSGKQRRTNETVLWEREESIARDKWITGAGGTRIPVLFYLPPDCTATDDENSNNEVVWRLAAEAAVPGVDFATMFKVPVYATGETAPPPAPGAPLLEEYSAQPLDATGLKGCGVRREGDTFYFSASHLPGTRLTTLILQLGLFGLLVWFWGRDIPGAVWAITIFFGLILSLFTLSVWCSKFELRVEGDSVVVTKPRPWGTKVTRVARAEVQAVKPAKSMSSGENQYFALSLVGAEPGKVAVPFAAHIPGQTKAEAIGALVLGVIRTGAR